MLQSDNAKLLILQSDKSKNSWLWVLFGGRRSTCCHRYRGNSTQYTYLLTLTTHHARSRSRLSASCVLCLRRCRFIALEDLTSESPNVQGILLLLPLSAVKTAIVIFKNRYIQASID